MNTDNNLLNEWFVVSAIEDIDNTPTSVNLFNQSILLVKLEGELKAFIDRCPHFGARLSLGEIKENCIECPYHGWTFNTNGECIKIPSQPELPIPKNSNLKSVPLVKHLGWIWICLGKNPSPLPSKPEWWESQKRRVYCGPYSFKALATRVIENFLDVTHLPYVHFDILGDPKFSAIPKTYTKITNNHLHVLPIKVWQPNPDSSSSGRYVEYSYIVTNPLFAEFKKKIDENNFRVLLSVTPNEDLLSTAWMIICLDYIHEGTDLELRDFQDRIILQDIAVVESIKPQSYRLKSPNEIPVRSDISTIAYRKWLYKNGITYGLEDQP